MSVLAQALLTLVLGDFRALPLFATWHAGTFR